MLHFSCIKDSVQSKEVMLLSMSAMKICVEKAMNKKKCSTKKLVKNSAKKLKNTLLNTTVYTINYRFIRTQGSYQLIMSFMWHCLRIRESSMTHRSFKHSSIACKSLMKNLKLHQLVCLWYISGTTLPWESLDWWFKLSEAISVKLLSVLDKNTFNWLKSSEKTRNCS